MKVKGTESWPNKEDTLALVLGSAKFSHMRKLAEDQLVGEAVGSVGVSSSHSARPASALP